MPMDFFFFNQEMGVHVSGQDEIRFNGFKYVKGVVYGGEIKESGNAT